MEWFNDIFFFITRNQEAIVASIVASIIFTIILFSLRPSLRISENIAKYYLAEEDVELFLFKIKNRSLFFKLYDIKARLWQVEYISTNNTALNTVETELALRKNEFWLVGSFFPWHIWQVFKPDVRLEKRTDYCCIFATKLNLEELVSNGKHVKIEIYSRHPLSGFAKVYSMLYQHKSNIKKGHFLSGNTFKIVN